VVGYNVYRAVGSSGALQLINSSPLTAAVYTDNAVVSGNTYVYVVKSLDASGKESGPSNQTTITVP
jgi:fibronectin type 3 domain-containing protein